MLPVGISIGRLSKELIICTVFKLSYARRAAPDRMFCPNKTFSEDYYRSGRNYFRSGHKND